MDLLKKVHIFEPMRTHISESNISLINLTSLLFNYVKPRYVCYMHYGIVATA